MTILCVLKLLLVYQLLRYIFVFLISRSYAKFTTSFPLYIELQYCYNSLTILLIIILRFTINTRLPQTSHLLHYFYTVILIDANLNKVNSRMCVPVYLNKKLIFQIYYTLFSFLFRSSGRRNTKTNLKIYAHIHINLS